MGHKTLKSLALLKLRPIDHHCMVFIDYCCTNLFFYITADIMFLLLGKLLGSSLGHEKLHVSH